jgi:hypothetical protein
MLIINLIADGSVVKVFLPRTLKLICDLLNLPDWGNGLAASIDFTVYQTRLSTINGHLFEVIAQIFAFVFP